MQNSVQVIAVDLANLCLRSDPRVRMGTTERPPLLFSDILDIMRDLEALRLTVPIFHLIDHSVEPYGMSADETRRLRKMEQAHPSDPRKIWRMGRRASRNRRKADDAICTLVNNRNAAVITDDQLRNEIETGRLRDSSRLVRFEAWRANRDEPFRFYNPGEQWDLDLHSVVDQLSAEQHVAEWTASARLVASHLGGAAKLNAQRLITRHVKTERDSKHEIEEATPEEIEEYLARSNEEPSRPSSIRWKIRNPAPVTTSPTESAPTATKPREDASHTPVSTFIFLKQADLKAHENRHVEVIARTFVNNGVVEFGMYAARRPLRLEIDATPEVKTSNEFSSAVGFLEFDGREWVLRNATWLGPVSTERRNAVMMGVATWTPPTFAPWGRLPRRRRSSVESPPGRDEPGTGHDDPYDEPITPGTDASPTTPDRFDDSGRSHHLVPPPIDAYVSRPEAPQAFDNQFVVDESLVPDPDMQHTVPGNPVSRMTPLSWSILAIAVLVDLLYLLR